MNPEMEESARLLDRFIAEQAALMEKTDIQVLENAIKWHNENCIFKKIHEKDGDLCGDAFLTFFIQMLSKVLLMRKDYVTTGITKGRLN